MKIAFVSGDNFALSPGREGLPDYMYQGLLVSLLLKAGHQVGLFAQLDKDSPLPGPILKTIDPLWEELDHQPIAGGGARLSGHGYDVVFAERVGKHAPHFEPAVELLRALSGEAPIFYHQYVGYAGWFPPVAEDRDLVRGPWTVLNRAMMTEAAFIEFVGKAERFRDGDDVTFKRWRPFLHDEDGWHRSRTPTSTRSHTQVYYGRLPKGERRSAIVAGYFGHDRWSRTIYGPPATVKWFSETTGALGMGRVPYGQLKHVLETCKLIVQVPFDTKLSLGDLGCWPNRVVECALAGVLQLFDADFCAPEFEQWTVSGLSDVFDQWSTAIEGKGIDKVVEDQRRFILPHTRGNFDKLVEILEGAS